jgi:hypothetical protein
MSRGVRLALPLRPTGRYAPRVLEVVVMLSLASNYTLLVWDHDGCELKPVNDNRRGLPSAATHLAEYFRPMVIGASLACWARCIWLVCPNVRRHCPGPVEQAHLSISTSQRTRCTY